ncbi:unnamed protein product, partial [Porites lobata]
QEERDLLELPVRLGGLGLVNPARTASQEYEASVKITGPLVRQIVKQAHEPPDETEIKTLQARARREKDELLKMQCEQRPDARLDVHARGFWDRQQSAFFDVRVCHPNADSYRELSPKQIFQLHENEKKRQYSRRVLEVEQGTFTPLVFTSTGGMADECKRFHSRLAELLALKKGDDYATSISWIRAKVSFAILRSALLCLRGTRSKRRAANISDIDITSESAQARI